QAAIAGAPADAGARILLAHQPRSAFAALHAGFDLQLSGHTHGGQFWPWMFFVRLQQPFTAGLHRLGRMWIYISRGTGYWGPPKRFGAPSEITLLELVPRTAEAPAPRESRARMPAALAPAKRRAHARGIAIGCAALLALAGLGGAIAFGAAPGASASAPASAGVLDGASATSGAALASEDASANGDSAAV